MLTHASNASVRASRRPRKSSWRHARQRTKKTAAVTASSEVALKTEKAGTCAMVSLEGEAVRRRLAVERRDVEFNLDVHAEAHAEEAGAAAGGGADGVPTLALRVDVEPERRRVLRDGAAGVLGGGGAGLQAEGEGLGVVEAPVLLVGAEGALVVGALHGDAQAVEQRLAGGVEDDVGDDGLPAVLHVGGDAVGAVEQPQLGVAESLRAGDERVAARADDQDLQRALQDAAEVEGGVVGRVRGVVLELEPQLVPRGVRHDGERLGAEAGGARGEEVDVGAQAVEAERAAGAGRLRSVGLPDRSEE